MRRPRRIYARAWRGSGYGWSRSPAGDSRGRYGKVVSAPPDASEVGSVGTSSRVSARAVAGLLPVWPGRLIETSRGSMSRPLTHSCGGCQEPAGGAGGVAFDGHLTIVSGYQSGLPARHERLPTERQRARSSGGSQRPRATVGGLVGASRGCGAGPGRDASPLASQIWVSAPDAGTIRRAPSGEPVAQAAIKDR